MSPKVVIAVVLGALAGASSAFVASKTSELQLHAFHSEGAMATQSARVARLNLPPPAPPPVALAPVTIVGSRAVRGVVRDGLPLTCQPWRRLLTGPGAADAASPMVRECDAAQMLDGSDPAPAGARLPAPPLPRQSAKQHWTFAVDMAAPR